MLHWCIHLSIQRCTVAVLVASEQLRPAFLQNHDPNVLSPRWLGIHRTVRGLRGHREKIVNDHFLVNSVEVQLTDVKSSRIVLLGDKELVYSVGPFCQGGYCRKEVAVIEGALDDIVGRYFRREQFRLVDELMGPFPYGSSPLSQLKVLVGELLVGPLLLLLGILALQFFNLVSTSL